MSERKLHPTIGLEIHAELLTQSKLFCSCSAEFGGEANSRCCPICSGMPGTLPMLNKKAVEYIIKAGLALGCEITRFTKWDRKNYFYPDLPKAYQVSQMPRPVCLKGNVNVNAGGKETNIRINRIHLEEDAGKLVHSQSERQSLADYNRGCIPLIEIVTEPDFHSAEEVIAFIEKIRLILQYAGVCDGKMEQGSLRCDVNISLAEKDAEKLGTRVEIKNLNSLKAIGRAIEYEIYRQTDLINSGGKVLQQTRRFDDTAGQSYSMRSKEEAQDYRYFPDPDIKPVILTDELIEKIKKNLPEMPDVKYKKYTEQMGLSEHETTALISNAEICFFFEESLKNYNNPKAVSSFILTELMRRMNLGEAEMNELPFSAEEFAKLVEYGYTDKINRSYMKDILRDMLKTGKSVKTLCDEQNLWVTEDTGAVKTTIEEIIKSNPSVVEQYKNGETKVFGFLMGQANKALKGAATPALIKSTLEEMLK